MRTIRRRRFENKTDYKSRFGLLKSGKPRLVIRKSNRYIVAQLITSNMAQDKVEINVLSKDLLANGWPKDKIGSLKSLAAAYLTGFLLAKKSKSKEAILDAGMYRSVKKSRIYAALKGAIDGGMKIPHNVESLPTMEDLKRNEKTAKLLELTKEIK